MKKDTHESNYYTNSSLLQLLIDEGFAEKVIPENDSVRLLDKIAVSKRFIEQRADSLKRITSETGILLRMIRILDKML